MRTRRLVATALLAAMPAAALVATAEAGSSSSRTVVLRDIAFTPAKLTIRRGQAVTFRWDDETTNHNVAYAGGKRFKGASTRAAGSHRVRFTKPGRYRYQCTLHLGMKGSITVK